MEMVNQKEEKEKMMNIILRMAAPYIIGIVLDMLTPEGVTDFVEKLHDLLRDLADKTENEYDDTIIEMLIEKALQPEFYAEFGHKICEMIKVYITNSSTKWDDVFILPVINGLDETMIDLISDG